jgi:MFS family permease
MLCGMLRRVGPRWILAYTLAMTGVAAGWFGPIQILLPAQAEALAGPGGKELLLSLITGWGAAAALFATPLWGAVSDRLGRRRPILIAGLTLGVLGLLLLAYATSPALAGAGWIMAQAGLAGPLAALASLLGDRVPQEQRGLVGSLFGVAQIAGIVLGTALAVLIGDVRLAYLTLAATVPALAAALMVTLRTEQRLPEAAGERGARGGGGLRITRAFAWAWTVRLLLNLVNALLLVYLFYYLQDRVGVGSPATYVLVVTLINVLVTAATATVGGPASDRLGRRRGFIAAGASALAAGATLLALVPALPAVLTAAALLGCGWGLYLAVDLAVITHVLPNAASRATMLGVANIAASLPQLLAPAIAAAVVPHLGGYPTLYLLTAAIALTALTCVPRLRP